MKAIDRDAIGRERRLVLRGAKALAHLIIVTRAQIEGRGGNRMSRRGEALGTGAHLVGDRDAGVEPGLVVLGVLVRQRASDLVQLADVGAAVACATENVHARRRPRVVGATANALY